jgi:hypothetical protein
MIGTTKRCAGAGRLKSFHSFDLGKRMEEIMRSKRNIIAPALLTLGAVGSILVGPVMALATAAAPSATAVASGTTSPNMSTYHA